MPVALEARLRQEATSKGLTGDKADSYVFGTLAKLKSKKTGVITPMATPMIQPSHRGLLHKHLGIPQGAKIPLSTLMRAKKSISPVVRKEANFALNFRPK